MGSLDLPVNGTVYVDSQIIVYTVEAHPRYAPALIPLWTASRDGAVRVLTSELAVLEVLVRPIRDGDEALQRDYRRLLLNSEITLRPVDLTVIQRAAELRASTPSLRTPDAIHAATARGLGCDVMLTNDRGLLRVPGLRVILLDDVTG